MISALIAAAAIFVFVWAQGVNRCSDGDRYTSSERQPKPFNRRFHHWPPRLLMVVTWASLIAIASMLGGWKASLLFVTLPGVWFCAVHPTTVDGPAMLLAWLSALAFQRGWIPLACATSALSGLMHERGPVFAALYAWSPLPLLGLAVPLLMGLRRPALLGATAGLAERRLLGHSLPAALLAHRPFNDLANPAGLLWSLRGLPLIAAYLGASPVAWVSLGVAYASRLLGTDTARFLMWAAPPLCAGANDAPLWMVALHVATFQRVMQ